ncbi:unnamed protein product, partial [Ectocarpus sp. 12 AP-2014]
VGDEERTCLWLRTFSSVTSKQKRIGRGAGVRNLDPHVRRGSAVSKHERRSLAVKALRPRWALAELVRQPYTPACFVPDETKHGMNNLMLIVTCRYRFTPRIALWASN